MKIAEIDWPLFRHALGQQDAVNRGLWLRRWVFADDGVRLSMQQDGGKTTSDDPANISDSSPDRPGPARRRLNKMTNRRKETAARGRTKFKSASSERGFYVIE
jgi:hypothetical protein